MTYTVTVYVAAPGTPLLLEKPGQTSLPGHMYYSVQAFGMKEQSFGFAPVEHGRMNGQGHRTRNAYTKKERSIAQILSKFGVEVVRGTVGGICYCPTTNRRHRFFNAYGAYLA